MRIDLEEYDVQSNTRVDPTPDIFERGIVGCLLRCPPAVTAKIAGQAGEDTFAAPRNQFVFTLLRNAALAQTPLGLEAAAAAINQSPGSLEHFNSLNDVTDYLEECVRVSTPHTSWPEYVKQHQLAYTRRKLMAAFDDATVSALKARNAEEAAADAIAKVIETAGEIRRSALKETYAISSAAERFLERYSSDEGIATPFPQEKLNVNGGHRPGQVIIVAANTGGRKSWTVLDWILDAARNHGKRGRIYSLEMDENDILERAIAMEHEVELEKVINREYSIDQMEEWLEDIAGLPVSIVDSRISPGRIIADIAALPPEERPQLVVVDHLDLFAWKDGNETNALKSALANFKDAAKQFGVTFFLVAQFRRPRNDDEAQHPHIGMLKGGSAIEQIADMVIFIRNELERGSYGDEEVSFMDIAKIRQGKRPRKFRVFFRKLRFR